MAGQRQRRCGAAGATGRLVVLLALLVVASACGESGEQAGGGRPAGAGSDALTIGWQVPWATQGQVVQALKHTDALATRGIQATFTGFTSGAPLNEAALGGGIDVLFTADQPAATLLAKGGAYTIVGRLMYNRVGMYVPPDSPVRSVADLRGKRVAMPFGTASQRVALAALQAAGLDPQRDVTIVNLDVTEQPAVVRSGSRSSWGEFDALVGFDPTPAVFETRGEARMLHTGQVVAVVVMADDLLRDRRDVAARFLDAYLDAWAHYAANPREANAWFAEEARFEPPVDDALALAASVEPNARAASVADLRVELSDGDVAVLQGAADFLAARNLIPQRVAMADHVDQRLLREVLARRGVPPAVPATAPPAGS